MKIAGGLAGFLGFDAAVRLAIDAGGLHLLPSQICSMLSAFGGLSLMHALAPSAAGQAHQALMPAVGWVGRWLPVFLVPVQVTLPTILFPGGAMEAAGLGLLLAGGWTVAVAGSARLVAFLAPQLPAAEASAAKAAIPRRLLWPAAWLFLAAAVPPDCYLPTSKADNHKTAVTIVTGIFNTTKAKARLCFSLTGGLKNTSIAMINMA